MFTINRYRVIKKGTLLLSALMLASGIKAQLNMALFRDSLDHKLDLSDWIINVHGFVPVPSLITEPAVGGFGVALVPVFLKKRTPIVDTTGGKRKITPVFPDILGIGAAYTINHTWFIGGLYSGTWKKLRIRYRLAGGYANANISFYHTFPAVGEKEFKLNFRSFPFLGSAIRQLGHTPWYAGLQYMLLQTQVRPGNETQLPDFIRDKEVESLISQPGIILERESRDNIFTPDKGVRFHVEANCSDNIFGSDYNYWRVNSLVYAYYPIAPRFIGGLRLEYNQAFNDIPFYALPYVDLRGVPAARYQGNIDAVGEAEVRWDLYKRWSLVLFSGTGKAFSALDKFGNADWVYNYGAGARYLIARKFKLRMGADIARGPEQWAYYIVFGSSWTK